MSLLLKCFFSYNFSLFCYSFSSFTMRFLHRGPGEQIIPLPSRTILNASAVLTFVLWMLLPCWSAVPKISAVHPGGNAVLSCIEGLLSLWLTVVAAFFATVCYWLTFNFWCAVTEGFLPGPLFPFPLCSCLGMLWSFIPVYPCPSFSFVVHFPIHCKVSSEAILWHILSFSAWSSLQIKD